MVVKIGSSTVVGADGKVNRAFIGGLADQAAALRELGWRLVVVSSGAIACGYPVLGFDRKPVGDLPSLQACASAGQCIISSAYDEEFHARDLLTSLVLLTRHDTARRTSYLHARDALLRLVELGVVPVVNENDTVTVDEIKFGDNDTLAALVSCLVSADLCVTLSDIDGLYTANPHEDPTAEFVPVVHKIDAKIIASAGDSSTSVGTGGMITKIRASRILMTAGIQSVICSGEEPDALVRLARGESVGTLFDPPAERLDIAPRKLWIALGDKAHGSVTVDDGAAKALVSRGSSLLAVGNWFQAKGGRAVSFGENLKKARKDAEMTQSELAQRVGITERSVYNYEKNSRAPKVDIVEKFAQALGVPSEILMRGLAGESTSGQWNEKELEKLLLQIQLMFDSGLDERRKERFFQEVAMAYFDFKNKGANEE